MQTSERTSTSTLDAETSRRLRSSRKGWKTQMERAEERRRIHVEEIRAARARYSLQAIADELGVSKARIAQIVNGE